MDERSCRDCRFARWQMTSHEPPRVNTKRSIRCECPPDRVTVVLPAAHDIFNESRGHALTNPRTWGHMALWYDRPYTDCATWEPKD